VPRSRTKERKKEPDKQRVRPFWSGTIAFGLVSLPVNLVVAQQGRAVSLRMLDEDGTPLTRRYFCPVEEKELDNDDIVRGFEVEKDEFVLVTDEELEALAPEKSQEIDLRRFVPVDEIDPVYFERAYFLLPSKGASKAYRLLARSMEEAGRAGIATFVMRGKEYLVAIIAQAGILRAETLRFADELRTPADVGLPEPDEVDAAEVQVLEKEIGALAAKRLERSDLADRQSRRLLELVREKLESGVDVLEAPEELEPEEEGEDVVDLMRVLKESLEEVGPAPVPVESPGGPPRAGAKRRKSRYGTLSEASKAELYEQAKELDISGRSSMTKEELIEAIRGPR
jgi:DNA end-binding protein Ku